MARFSWRRGIKHALVPFGLAIIAGLVLFEVGDAGSLTDVGGTVVPIAVVLFAGGLGMSSLIQRRRRLAALVIVLVVIAAVVGLTVFTFASLGHHRA